LHGEFWEDLMKRALLATTMLSWAGVTGAQTCSVPGPAVAAGCDAKAYGANGINLSTSVNPATSYPEMTDNTNLVPDTFFGDGSITWNRYVPGQSAPDNPFAVMDELHMVTILGAGSGSTVTFSNLQVVGCTVYGKGIGNQGRFTLSANGQSWTTSAAPTGTTSAAAKSAGPTSQACIAGGTLTTSTTSQTNPFATGTVLWGAVGHIGQGGVYTSIPLSQQITDLQNIFGKAPEMIIYRAIGDDGPNPMWGTDVAQLQAAGIIPIIVVPNPNFASLTSQTAAYAAGYVAGTADVKAAPTEQVWEMGNEWDLTQPIFDELRASGTDGSTAADWTSLPSFQKYLGYAAGEVAAIRALNPSAQIVGGMDSGWKRLGFAGALSAGLANYNGQNMMWDYTVLHWYNDASPFAGDAMGQPDNSNAGMNAYSMLAATGKPVLVTETGSSDGNDPWFDAAAGNNITQLMANYLAHTRPSNGTTGVVGAAIYQLYQQPGAQTDYDLYTVNGTTTTLSPMGAAVKTWVAAHPLTSASTDSQYTRRPDR
jgi:hypothetical protein